MSGSANGNGNGNGASRTRVLFVNSGILGHRAVAGLLQTATGLIPSIQAEHINLSGDLTFGDRVRRRLWNLRLAPSAAFNLDLRRWRAEMNVGLLASRRIAQAERRERFDVVHFHPQPTAYGSLSRMKRTRAIVSIDATQQLARCEASSRLDRATYYPNIVHDGLVFRRAAAITAVSQWAARNLAANYPDCASKVHVMPYPVATIGCDAWIEERFERSRRGDDRVRVLFMGGDFPRKGGPALIEAWRVAGLGDRAALDLVTDWPIDEETLPPGVRVIGDIAPHTARWRELWRRADLFVMPTAHEAFGMVFQEAAAAGIPAVGTNINAIPEIVQDGTTGLLVAPGEGAALVAAVRTLIESADLRRRMGAAALNRMRGRATPERYAADLEHLIHAIDGHHELQTA